MKRLLLPLLAAIALPSSIFAEPIPKISDYELSVDIGEKIKFKCPVKRERDKKEKRIKVTKLYDCLLYTSPSPRDKRQSRMPSSA